MAESRRPQLPPARATGLFARTVYKELKRAQYSKVEIVGFINDLIDVVTGDPDRGPISGVTDPETHLANADVLIEALDFEIRRAREIGGKVLVTVVDLDVPDWIADDVVQRLHAAFARGIRRGVRAHDTVARLHSRRYVAVTPGASLASAAIIASRLGTAALRPRRAGDDPPGEVSVRTRSLEYDGATGLARAEPGGASSSVESAEAVLARAQALPATPAVASTEVAARPVRASSMPPASAPTDVILALGGGAARAAAHIGVLRALDERGMRVVGIAGTSAGAVVGAMFLLGMGHDEMLERFAEFPRTPTYKAMRRLYAEYRRGRGSARVHPNFRQTGLAFMSDQTLAAIDDGTFTAFVEHFVGPDRDVRSLRAPLVMTATDLGESRLVVLGAGQLHAALRATCAVPGLFAPQSIDGRVLVDGSVIGEVPVKAALSLGLSGRLIAVHLGRPDQRVDAFLSSAEILTRASSVMHAELVREQLRHAPELVTLPLGGVGWLDFRRARENVELGFEAMRSQLVAPRVR